MSKTSREFERLWSEQEDISLLGKFMFKVDRRKIFSLLEYADLTPKSTVLDVGCGTGNTLKLIRGLGYENSIGCDVAESSIRLCEKNGLERNKDVFLEDIVKSSWKRDFDLVFSEGSIEHYNKIQPIVDGICKASRKYVLTCMPNLESQYWVLFEMTLKMMGRKHAKDYNHSEDEYLKAFKKAGFKLVKMKMFSFNRGWIMLFKRC